MERIAQAPIAEEPIGIVISSGTRTEAAPRFWAYEWWPGPEETETGTASSGTTKAA